MVAQIQYNQVQAWDSNGDPAAGAKARFFDTGTTTPKTVYSDTDLTTPVAVPLVADSNGVFAPVYFSGSSVKVTVTDADDVALYTLDPAPVIAGSATAASGITFSATAAIPQTNVQDAIEQVQTNLSAPTELDLSSTDITWSNDQIPGTAVEDATTTNVGVVELSTTGQNRTGTATDVVPTVAGVVEIIEGTPVGWQFWEALFDSGDGTEETATTSDFEDYYEYRIYLRNLSHDSGSDQTLKITVIRANDESEQEADTGISIAGSSAWNGYIDFFRSRRSGDWTAAQVSISTGSMTYGSNASSVAEPTVKNIVFGHGTATKIKAVKISTASGVEFDGGYVGVYRRIVGF